MSKLIRRATFTGDPVDQHRLDITDQLPRDEHGRPYFHPGAPGSEPFFLEEGDRLISYVYGNTQDIIVVDEMIEMVG